jgi:hypothetical protein
MAVSNPFTGRHTPLGIAPATSFYRYRFGNRWLFAVQAQKAELADNKHRNATDARLSAGRRSWASAALLNVGGQRTVIGTPWIPLLAQPVRFPWPRSSANQLTFS